MPATSCNMARLHHAVKHYPMAALTFEQLMLSV